MVMAGCFGQWSVFTGAKHGSEERVSHRAGPINPDEEDQRRIQLTEAKQGAEGRGGGGGGFCPSHVVLALSDLLRPLVVGRLVSDQDWAVVAAGTFCVLTWLINHLPR